MTNNKIHNPKKTPPPKITLVNIATSILLIALLLYVLFIAKELIIPFVIALFLVVVIKNSAKFITDKLPPIFKHHPIRVAVGYILSLTFMIISIYGIYQVVNNNINSVVEQSGKYQKILISKVDKTRRAFDKFINKNDDTPLDPHSIKGKISVAINKIVPKFNFLDFSTATIQKIPFQQLFGGISNLAKTIATNMTMIIIYMLFLFLESNQFSQKIDRLEENGSPLIIRLKPIALRINHDFIEYIKIKTISSFTTGFTSFLILSAFGLDFASFWGFLIFLFNYIPTIGSIVAVMFPITLSIIQYDSLAPIIGIIVSLTAVQFLIGNILEPRFFGKTLNLSPLVILFSLGIWGKLWGVVGMFLSVPIMVSINIVLSNFETTKNLAIFLSSDGNISNE